MNTENTLSTDAQAGVSAATPTFSIREIFVGNSLYEEFIETMPECAARYESTLIHTKDDAYRAFERAVGTFEVSAGGGPKYPEDWLEDLPLEGVPESEKQVYMDAVWNTIHNDVLDWNNHEPNQPDSMMAWEVAADSLALYLEIGHPKSSLRRIQGYVTFQALRFAYQRSRDFA